MGSYPSQRAVNGQWRKVIQLRADTTADTTSDLTLAPFILAMA
jgi:hypothetical protein